MLLDISNGVKFTIKTDSLTKEYEIDLSSIEIVNAINIFVEEMKKVKNDDKPEMFIKANKDLIEAILGKGEFDLLLPNVNNSFDIHKLSCVLLNLITTERQKQYAEYGIQYNS